MDNSLDFIPDEYKGMTLSYRPEFSNLVLMHDDQEVGRLTWNGEGLVFTGKIEESARVFVDWCAPILSRKVEALVLENERLKRNLAKYER